MLLSFDLMERDGKIFIIHILRPLRRIEKFLLKSTSLWKDWKAPLKIHLPRSQKELKITLKNPQPQTFKANRIFFFGNLLHCGRIGNRLKSTWQKISYKELKTSLKNPLPLTFDGTSNIPEKDKLKSIFLTFSMGSRIQFLRDFFLTSSASPKLGF